MNISKQFAEPLHVSRILIIQLGDIGDVVWSLPALQAVREAYPAAGEWPLVDGEPFFSLGIQGMGFGKVGADHRLDLALVRSFHRSGRLTG